MVVTLLLVILIPIVIIVMVLVIEIITLIINSSNTLDNNSNISNIDNSNNVCDTNCYNRVFTTNSDYNAELNFSRESRISMFSIINTYNDRINDSENSGCVETELERTSLSHHIFSNHSRSNSLSGWIGNSKTN